MSTNSALGTPLRAALISLVLLFVFALTGIALEKPTGSIAGRISLEQPRFGLQSNDIRKHKVYALAVGPAGGPTVERGVWINDDGTFRLDRLPVGEYSLRVRALGFATAYQSGVFVDEAKTTHLKDSLELHILEPSVNLASNSRVFTTSEQPYFWINAMGSSEATIYVYKRDLPDLLAMEGDDKGLSFGSTLNLYKPWSREPQKRLFENQKPLLTLHRKLVSDTEDWARADVKIDQPLAPGDYLAVAEVKNLKGDSDWNLMWFSVSNLGLIIKQAPDQTLVRAIDLQTLQPVSGAEVRLQEKANPKAAPRGSARTGTDGFARFPSRNVGSSDYLSLIAVGNWGKHRAYGGIDYWNSDTERYETYFYTERPIYRLGQTVYFKGISRFMTQDGLTTPKSGTTVTVTIEDPDNNSLWEKRLTTSRHGTFNGVFEIPENGKTGAYQATIAYPNGDKDYQRFEVAQYRKPEYQVEVTPLQERVTAGQPGRARIRATYYFGAPVANARVKYTVYAATDWDGRYALMDRPDYYGYYDDWRDEDADYGGYAGQYVTEGYAQTNEAGEAIVTFDTQELTPPLEDPYGEYMDQRYTVQAEVTDLSRMSVIGSGKVPVAAGLFTLFVEPERYVYRVGESITASVRAVDYDGKPVANQRVEVNLRRWKWDSVNGEYRGYDDAASQTVVTDEQGRARLSLVPKGRLLTDSYNITALSQDRQGNAIYQQDSVWIASDNAPYVRSERLAQQEAFTVKLDKSVYQPGETAKVMITAPLTGKENADVLVTVEGQRLHTVRVVRMDATAKLVEVPLTEDYTPNVYVAATLVGPKHQYYHQEEMIKVSPEAHFLNIAVSSNKLKYQPGETATYTIKATYPDGKPAANTELSLGIVDESIYAIRPEAARDIRKFFYRRRPNLVATYTSFPEEYSGGPDKIEPRVRKDFRDVAAWYPALMTDERGVATATLKLPDNLTTWRATVRGVNLANDVGWAVHKVIATQDILVRLALPRFYTQHDKATVTAVVHNYSGQAQDIRLDLTLPDLLESDEAPVQRLALQPEEAKRFTWPVSVLQPGQATVKVKAIGQTGGDALERTVPVRPLGIDMALSESGILRNDPGRLTIPLQLSDGVDPGSAKVRLGLSASSIGPMMGSFDQLIDYPYGCTEQTMSRLMPSVIAMRLHRALDVPLPDEARKRFDEVYRLGMARLRDLRHLDGGWGWWEHDESDPYMTAYVMENLFWLEQAGYPVDFQGADWKKEGADWLKEAAKQLVGQMRDPKVKEITADHRINLAYLHYVLSLYGQTMPKETRKFLLDQRQKAPPEALALQTLAFARLKDADARKQSLSALNRLASTASGMVNWDHTLALAKRLGYTYHDYTYRFTGVESTALGLRAAVAGGESPERLEAIKQWLLLQRNLQGWDNTKTTAQVLLALMEEQAAAGDEATPDFTVASNLLAAPITFDPGSWYAPEQVFESTLDRLTGLAVRLEKNGAGRLFYNTLLTYVQPLKPGDFVRQPAMPEGLRIRRTFHRITAKPVGPEGTIRLQATSLPGNRVKAGETVLMRITVESPVALPYILVDVALPSGGEVVMDDPRAEQMDAQASGFSYDWGPWWWSHQDVLDDRVVLFARTLPAGKAEFHSMVRMELPGRFQMNPVKLEGMYSRRIRALSSLDAIEVTE